MSIEICSIHSNEINILMICQLKQIKSCPVFFFLYMYDSKVYILVCASKYNVFKGFQKFFDVLKYSLHCVNDDNWGWASIHNVWLKVCWCEHTFRRHLHNFFNPLSLQIIVFIHFFSMSLLTDLKSSFEFHLE